MLQGRGTMKRIAYTTYAWCIFGILGSAALIFSVKMACAHIFNTNHYTISIDDRISPDIQKNITHTIHDYCIISEKNTQKKINFVTLADQLQENFNCIESVELQHAPDNYAHLEIHAHTPYFNVRNKNSIEVATHSGLILPCASFTNKTIDGLRTIAVADHIDSAQLPIVCMHSIKKIPEVIFDEYTFVWHNNTYIELCKKNNPSFSLLLSEESKLNITLINYCNVLYNQLHTSGAFIEKKKKRWIADVRFKDQIIMYTRRGR